MKLTVKKPFSWAHKGVTIEAFEKGQVIETDDEDLIDVATKEGWASKEKGAGKQAEDPGAGKQVEDPGAGNEDKGPEGAGDADASTAPGPAAD